MPQSRQSANHMALQIGVILCAVGLSFYHWTNADPDSDENQLETSEENLSVRNERSVPRSFILPATPGVANVQEAQQADPDRQGQIVKCVGALRALGYQPGEGKTVLNAKLVEAVYTFQLAHKLSPTGRLDELTMGMLKCV